MYTFTKIWERPENITKKCPIACYKCGILTILQYGENYFRPKVNHIMLIGEKPKSFKTLEEAVAYVNSDEYI